MKQLITIFLLLMTVSPQAFASSHDLSSQDEPNLLVKRTGDVVLVADKFNKQYDIVVAFKKCMANELMTFQRVYLAKNSNLNVNENSFSHIDISLNTTTSDNIGPVLANGGWIGGNHVWSDKITHTAQTDSSKFLADDQELADGELLNCKELKVVVWNTIFDYNSIIDPLLLEKVEYTVGARCAIGVHLSHTYQKATWVTNYYGMQSMFNGEKEICTIGGAYPSFTPIYQVKAFSKKDYPNMKGYIEKCGDGFCQSAILNTDYGLGTHEMIDNNKDIFIYSSNKCYHVLIKNKSIAAGTTLSWKGKYEWFKDSLLGDVNEDEAVDMSDVTELVNYILNPYKTQNEIKFDINRDATINVSDVSMIISLILSLE